LLEQVSTGNVNWVQVIISTTGFNWKHDVIQLVASTTRVNWNHDTGTASCFNGTSQLEPWHRYSFLLQQQVLRRTVT